MTYGRHFFAGSRTFSTHFGAFSTMLHAHFRMFIAFFRTTMADVGAETAELIAEPAAHAHNICCGVTDSCTLQIQLDTGFQRLNILLVQARRRAVITFRYAGTACFNTLIILLMWHKISFYRLNNPLHPFHSSIIIPASLPFPS